MLDVIGIVFEAILNTHYIFFHQNDDTKSSVNSMEWDNESANKVLYCV